MELAVATMPARVGSLVGNTRAGGVRKDAPAYVDSDTVEDLRWDAVMRQHPAFKAGTMDLYGSGSESGSS